MSPRGSAAASAAAAGANSANAISNAPVMTAGIHRDSRGPTLSVPTTAHITGAEQQDGDANGAPSNVPIPVAVTMPFVRGDSKRLAQAITKILSNAVKFTPADGVISVKAYNGPDGSVLIEIADTGIGMAPERIETALAPFRQIDETVGRRYEGLGLGLPLAHALIRLHGGRLAITSTVGKGTTVNIALPPERVIESPDFIEVIEAHAKVA